MSCFTFFDYARLKLFRSVTQDLAPPGHNAKTIA